MINDTRLIYLLGITGIPIVARLWVRFRKERRERREAQLPLFDAVLLEVALTPKKAEGDDADILIEMRQTLAHLNRRMYAEEFWGLDEQLAAYYEQIPGASQPTMRRAILRLLAQPDRWLQSIAAKTSARLGLTEAEGPITALLEKEEAANTGTAGVDARFRRELAAALEKLTGEPVPEEQPR